MTAAVTPAALVAAAASELSVTGLHLYRPHVQLQFFPLSIRKGQSYTVHTVRR